MFGSEAADEEGSERQQLRIQESFSIDRRRKEGSEHQPRRIQEKICIGEASQQAQLIDEKESKSGPSSAEDPGELLHRQSEDERFETSAEEDPGEDLHQRSITAGSTHRRERIKEGIFIGKGTRRDSTLTDGERKVIKCVARIDRTQERSKTGRTERKVGNQTNSRTVGNRTN